MCFDPVDPGGKVRGCSVGWPLGMLDVLPFGAASALGRAKGVSRNKKNAFSGGCFFGAAEFRATSQ